MNLNLETKEVDVVLNILSGAPWRDVHLIIQKVMNQANDPAFQADPPVPAPLEEKPQP